MNMTRTRTIRASALILMILFAASGLRSQTTTVLQELSLQKEGERLNVFLKIEGPYSAEASFLPAPPRLALDLTPVSQIAILPYTQIDDIGVLDVRTGQFKPDTVRVVFDLSQNIPAYTVVQTAEGVKISFYYEGAVPPIQAPVAAPVTTEPAKAAEPAAQAAQVAAPPAAAAVPRRSDFFIAARGGFSFFLGSDLSANKEFDLYGEAATLDELYTFDSVPAFELQLGKYFGRTKLGLGVANYSLKQAGTFTASLPHPFIADSYRTVVFEAADLKNTTWEFSVFALFSFMETEKLGLSAGPILGLASGSMTSLSNFDLSEESPYDAAGVTISNMSFVEDKFSELFFGGILNLEYKVLDNLSLLLDARIVYLNPKNATLGQRAYLLHLQPVLGIQYNF